jgi:hypothetical protein
MHRIRVICSRLHCAFIWHLCRASLCLISAIVLNLGFESQAMAEGDISSQKATSWKCDSGYLFLFNTPEAACRSRGPYPLNTQGNTLCSNGQYALATTYDNIAIQSVETDVVVFKLLSTTTYSGPGNCPSVGLITTLNFLTAYGDSTYTCPDNALFKAGSSSECECKPGFTPFFRNNKLQCLRTVVEDNTGNPQLCFAKVSLGNPIAALTATKHERIDTTLQVAGIPLNLFYNSKAGSPRSKWTVPVNAYRLKTMGEFWSHTFQRYVTGDTLRRSLYVGMGDGREVRFVANGPGVWIAPSAPQEKLQSLVGGGYRYTSQIESSIIDFDSGGRPLSLTSPP